jgi:hypothetical protein
VEVIGHTGWCSRVLLCAESSGVGVDVGGMAVRLEWPRVQFGCS